MNPLASWYASADDHDRDHARSAARGRSRRAARARAGPSPTSSLVSSVAEDLLEVGPQPEVAGDVDLEPAAGSRRSTSRAVLAPVGDAARSRAARSPRCTRRRRPPTRGPAARRARTAPPRAGSPGSPRRPAAASRAIRALSACRQAALALVDDQADARLAAREAVLEQLLHLAWTPRSAGRKLAVSSLVTSATFAASGDSAATATIHSAITTHLVRRPDTNRATTDIRRAEPTAARGRPVKALSRAAASRR